MIVADELLKCFIYYLNSLTHLGLKVTTFRSLFTNRMTLSFLTSGGTHLSIRARHSTRCHCFLARSRNISSIQCLGDKSILTADNEHSTVVLKK